MTHNTTTFNYTPLPLISPGITLQTCSVIINCKRLWKWMGLVCLQKQKNSLMWLTDNMDRDRRRSRVNSHRSNPLSQGSVATTVFSQSSESHRISKEEDSHISLLSYHLLLPLQLSVLSGLCIQANTSNWRQLKPTAVRAVSHQFRLTGLVRQVLRGEADTCLNARYLLLLPLYPVARSL